MMPVTGSTATLTFGKVLYAVFISRALTWSGVNLEFCCSSKAAAPLTTGVAMLVPLSDEVLCDGVVPPRRWSCNTFIGT